MKLKLVFCVGCFLSAISMCNNEETRVSYNGVQLWQIENTNKAEEIIRKFQEDNYLSTWFENHTVVDAVIPSQYRDEIRTSLETNEIKYKVSISDMQALIDAEKIPKRDEAEVAQKQGHPLTWKRYHELKDINAFLEAIDIKFPTLCTLKTIGYSAEGRPIKLLKISINHSQQENNAIFIEGGIHAREWVSPAAATYIINTILHTYHLDGRQWMKDVDWYIVPVLNPDGYEYSHNVDRLWRKNRSVNKGTNCKGVDLNRNFAIFRDLGEKDSRMTDPCSSTYAGSKEFSEPETTAVRNFIINNRYINWRGYISLHSYGQFIAYPWAAKTRQIPDHQDLKKLADQAQIAIYMKNGGMNYTVGPLAMALYPASGTSVDWARGEARIKYTYLMELRDTGKYGVLLPPKQIEASANDVIHLLKKLAKIVAPL